MPENVELYKEVFEQYKQFIIWMATGFATLLTAISFLSLKLLRAKDGHIKDKEAEKQAMVKVIENVIESNNKIAVAIDTNTTALETNTRATEAHARASDKQTEKYSELHIEILKAMVDTKASKKRTQ